MEKLWQIEVHLQFDLMYHVFKPQLMDTHSHARNGARSIKWKIKALQHRGPSVLQEVGLTVTNDC